LGSRPACGESALTNVLTCRDPRSHADERIRHVAWDSGPVSNEDPRRQNHPMVRYRRPIALTVAVPGLICATLSVVHVFDIADVPGGAFFGTASLIFLIATWIFLDVPSAWRTPRPDR
jgi:hypothetical protein